MSYVRAADRRAAESRIVQRRWRERIDRWLRSDKEERVFCAREKIGVCALRWWMRRLGARKGAEAGAVTHARTTGSATTLRRANRGIAPVAVAVDVVPANTEAARKWARLSAEWERSGVRQAEFCRRRGLAVHALRWWRWRLGGRGREERAPLASTLPASEPVLVAQPAFVPIEVVGEVPPRRVPPPPILEILLRRQRRVRVGAAFDPALLARVVAVLEATP